MVFHDFAFQLRNYRKTQKKNNDRLFFKLLIYTTKNTFTEAAINRAWDRRKPVYQA